MDDKTLIERAANEICAVLMECCTVEECENTLAQINPADWQRAAQKVLDLTNQRDARSYVIRRCRECHGQVGEKTVTHFNDCPNTYVVFVPEEVLVSWPDHDRRVGT